MKKTITTTTCDMPAPHDGGISLGVQLSLDNVAVEMDLCTRHEAKIREACDWFATFARKIPPPPEPRQRKSRTTEGRRRSRDIRAWAAQEGIRMEPSGRIRASVIDAYEARDDQ